MLGDLGFDQTEMHSARNVYTKIFGHTCHHHGISHMVHLELTVTISVAGGERSIPQDRRLEKQTTTALEQRLSYGSEATQSLPQPLQRDSSQMSLSGVSLMPEPE